MPRPPACFWSTNPRNNVLRIDMFWAKAKTAIIGWSPPLYHFRSQWTHPSFATGLKPIICLFSNEKKGPLKNAFLGLLFQIESGQFKRHETFNDAFCQNDYQKKWISSTAGFEPAIFWFVVRRVVRCATRPLLGNVAAVLLSILVMVRAQINVERLQRNYGLRNIVLCWSIPPGAISLKCRTSREIM